METLKLRVSAQKFKAFSRIDRKAVVLGFDDVVEKGVSLKNARLMGDALVASKQKGAQGLPQGLGKRRADQGGVERSAADLPRSRLSAAIASMIRDG